MDQGVTSGPAEPICEAVDRKGLRCQRSAGHENEVDSAHKRYAVEGEAPYLPGPGNSIVSWPIGPPPQARPRIA